MAMLAESKRKQTVINLRAKNNDWTNNKNKFGQKMLEKMGWREGKGLGANENGIAEHVIARYKNDEKGLGFVDKNDQWTKHEDDFNTLLANLSNASTDDNVPSCNSLEKKSKSSKARIHYQKFTRGKDLSRYSEKDLANIFGKKSFKNNDGVKTKQAVIEAEQPTGQGQIFTEKGNMNDYFKSKLAALKSKSLKEKTISCEEDVADYCFQGFSGGYKLEQESSIGFGYNSTREHFSSHEPNGKNENYELETKKKKKKSKCKIPVIDDENILVPQNDILSHSQTKSNKKKRKRDNSNDVSEDINVVECENIIGDINNPKSCDIHSKITNYIEEESKPKKKKKSSKDKKVKHIFEQEIVNEVIPCAEIVDYAIDNVEKAIKKKKEKTSKKFRDQEHVLDQDLSVQSHVKRKKKKNQN